MQGLDRGLAASYLGTVETAIHLVLYVCERLKVLIRQRLRGGNNASFSELETWISTSGAAGSAKTRLHSISICP